MLEAKNIVITGGSRGIGKATAERMLNEGHRVAVLSRKDPLLSGANYRWIECDLEQTDTLGSVVELLLSWMPKVDVLVHNSGYLVNAPFGEISISDLERSYRVNVFGPFVLTQLLQPALMGSHIIGISSMGGVNGSAKFPGLSAYSSSKGALITLFELLQEELGAETGQTFNILALGAVKTEMLLAAFPGYTAPMGAEDMAEFVHWFALNGHKYFKGKVLPVSVSTP